MHWSIVCGVALLAFVPSFDAQRGQTVSEGREFMAAFPPARGVGGVCTIMITAKQNSIVTIRITGDRILEQLSVAEMTTRYYDVACGGRTITGVEDKGVRLSANHPVTVVLYSTDFDNRPSGFLLFGLEPRGGRDIETYRISALGNVCNGNFETVIIAADRDNTQVDIFHSEFTDGMLHVSLVLDRYQTYTLIGYPEITFGRGLDGWYVDSRLAITVISGAPCVEACNGGVTGLCRGCQAWDMVLSTEDIGTEYVIPPIFDYELTPGDQNNMRYEIYVTSNQVLTTVDIDVLGEDDRLLLVRGESTYYYIEPAWIARHVVCNVPCVLNMLNWEYHAAPFQRDTGIFWLDVAPIDMFSNYIVFATPQNADRPRLNNYISIIVDKNEIEWGDIFLNGQDLYTEDNDFIARVQMRSINLMLTPGSTYVLYSERTTFAAYVYGMGDNEAYAYQAGFNVIDNVPQPPTPPTPPAPTLPTIQRTPHFISSVSSEFVSDEVGEPISFPCIIDYSNVWTGRVNNMVSTINEQMESICGPTTPETMRVVDSSSVFFADGQIGGVHGDFFINTNIEDPFDFVAACGASVAEFLVDKTNWGLPLLPWQPDCPILQFPGTEFMHNNTDWFCGNTVSSVSKPKELEKGDHYRTVVHDAQPPSEVMNPQLPNEVPSQGRPMNQWFDTIDENSLSSECVLAYSNQWSTRISNMVGQINDEISSGELCVGDPGIRVRRMVGEFIGAGALGRTGVTISMRGTYLNSMASVDRCGEEVVGRYYNFINWGLPLLTGEFGCPNILFRQALFNQEIPNWECDS